MFYTCVSFINFSNINNDEFQVISEQKSLIHEIGNDLFEIEANLAMYDI
jgi:hypothetical protein